jgi:hypothetical protein
VVFRSTATVHQGNTGNAFKVLIGAELMVELMIVVTLDLDGNLSGLANSSTLTPVSADECCAGSKVDGATANLRMEAVFLAS